MKYLKYLILLIPILTVNCSKQEIVLTEDQIPEDIFYLKEKIKPYTGRCLVYYHGTELLKEEMNFRNGILDGSHVSYYREGSIKRIGSYCEGNLNGIWMGFDSKGNKIYEVEYKNDTLIGRFISWYSTGIIKQKGGYLNNEKVGEWVSYDEAGMIIRKIIL